MTYYVQQCPTCGRALQVRLRYLGKKVVCRHCQGEFIASDPENPVNNLHDDDLLARADQLLSTYDSSQG